MEKDIWIVDKDEWYPVFTLEQARSSGYLSKYEVPTPSDEFLARYKQVMRDFDSLQRELSEIYPGKKYE